MTRFTGLVNDLQDPVNSVIFESFEPRHSFLGTGEASKRLLVTSAPMIKRTITNQILARCLGGYPSPWPYGISVALH